MCSGNDEVDVERLRKVDDFDEGGPLANVALGRRIDPGEMTAQCGLGEVAVAVHRGCDVGGSLTTVPAISAESEQAWRSWPTMSG